MSQNNESLEAISQVSECTTNYITYFKENSTNIEPKATSIYLENLNSIKESVKPYLPLFKNIITIIQDIINGYENAQINKKICLTLIIRSESIGLTIKQLERKKSDNLEKFRNKKFYQSFLRLYNILKRMDKFIQDITLLSNIRKLIEIYSIKKQFREILIDFDNVAKDLNFPNLIIYDEKQRQEDIKIFRDEFNNIMKFFETIDSGIATVITQNNQINYQINTTILELLLLKSKVQKQSTNFDDKWKPKLITNDDLQDSPTPLEGQLTGKCLKKILIKENKQVSLIPADSIPYNTVDYQKNIILDYIKMKLGHECKHIHQFYGMAQLNQNFFSVYEWTDLGKLSEVYEKYDLDWSTKLRISLDILSGIIFLNCCDILHKSIKCENILMTDDMKPKITNIKFDFNNKNASGNATSHAYSNWLKDVYILAPEIIDIQNYPKRYTSKSQIYSIGMLLWELTFQRIPYKDWQIATVQNHVLSGKREVINFGGEPSPIQQGFINLIEAAWQQEPDDRPDIITFFNMLYSLYSNYYMGESNSLQKRASSSLSKNSKIPKRDVLCANSNVIIKTNNQQVSNVPLRNGTSSQGNNSPASSVSSSSSSSSSSFSSNPAYNPIVPISSLSDGINAHKKGDKEKAWECFEANAQLGNISAIYWQGYYLWEGYHIPADHVRAVNCYKEAAKNGHADAQLRYAFSAINKEKINIKGFLKFLKMSANEGNALALFNLGDVYLNGKFGIEKDENLGIKYLKVAAVLKQPKAIEILKNLNVTDTFYL
ncbi:uncharacterized protein OCT59_019658 [Rhizophagus irregularis]|uniref:Kin1p n=2 Tax=Rhizophagus irregularis TaxID=588596 RepID=A0A015K0X8_RHIIW|nr:kinase-like domain-containing protein [Rhizophagus irregularis DAOM 181602=DAOM 197198]EXX75442.1 Kin1p [Rhizophagus irregularis DAOM 197198w]POG68513.1 kinase-like domain-containing protein [Rhizophagus irregularis DAOM 181602=DAOM 197198]UZO27465.1 hypothetical protein OCT59_019658 [Rhizophagus irregularis]GBC51735.1 kinase-like domain-containing protein [Rhizophagus irregularis DAOM 181602=DAOM 197198]|eukprot:XP_025175379.1 kinase-like domain-containing protein [Rhizophagus irregularis DAOM 181602=DAOM 197198]